MVFRPAIYESGKNFRTLGSQIDTKQVHHQDYDNQITEKN